MNEFYSPEQSKQTQKSLDESNRTTVDLQTLPPNEREVVKSKMKVIDELLKRDLRATFKIEVHFGKGRSSRDKPFAGLVNIFKSGTHFNGEGDSKVYICSRPNCKSIIYPSDRINGQLLCRRCNELFNEKDVVGEIVYVLPASKWAHVIHSFFVRLGHDADIYLKYHPEDIRYKTMMAIARQRGGEEINLVRKRRALHIYPLANIVKDVSGGADLYKRILVFITA